MGISLSPDKISASIPIGGTKGSTSIDRSGNVSVDIGIDLGIAGIGVTSNYGGAVTGKVNLGIIGMEVQLGSEGGKSVTQAGFGLLEVKVESKNCVVTETKSIAGQVVATRTYRDPGCSPEPEPVPGNDIEQPPPVIPPGSTGLEVMSDSQQLALVSINTEAFHYLYGYIQPLVRKIKIVKSQGRFPPIDTFSDRDFAEGLNINTVYYKFSRNPAGPSSSRNLQATRLTYYYITSFTNDPKNASSYTNFCPWLDENSVTISAYLNYNPIANDEGLVFYGTIARIHKYIQTSNRWNEEERSRSLANRFVGEAEFVFMTAAYVLPIGEIQQKRLPTGNTPPMNNDCCEEINDKLDDLLEIIDVKRFKKNGFPLPAYLLAPGCDTAAVVKNKTYYDLMQQFFRAIAHTAIVNPEVNITDSDSAKEGNQGLTVKYLSATGWAEGVTKMLLEAVDDGNVGTNCDIRTAVTVTQLLVAVADLSYKVDAIIDCIGVTTKRSKATVTTSYNLVVDDGSKGFGKDKQQQIDKNTDLTTEALLPQLLRTRENTVVKEEIHPKSQTLVELLQGLSSKANNSK